MHLIQLVRRLAAAAAMLVGCARPSATPPSVAPPASEPAIVTPTATGDGPAAWERACDRDEVDACLKLATAHFEGKDVEKNFTKMARYEKRACELGSAEGCAWLGNSHARGHPGFPRDLARAAGLWMQACEEGHADACASAAKVFHAGEAVARDDKRAQGLLDRGCRLGAKDQCGDVEHVLAPINESVIRDAVEDRGGLVRHCYDLALLADPSIQGRVTVELTISPYGEVVQSAVIGNDTGDPELGECIGLAARELRFPEPGGHDDILVQYPFVLMPEAGSRPRN